MTMTPIEKVLAKFPNAKRSGAGWVDRCPAHEDRKASLSIGKGDDGNAMLFCHAGCDTADVLAEAGLTWPDVFPEDDKPGFVRNGNGRTRNGKAKSKPKSNGPAFATDDEAITAMDRIMRGKHTTKWPYCNADGELVGWVLRWDRSDGDKDIRPVSLHEDGWRLAAMPAPRPLYNLAEVLTAKLVIVCEGEKAADAARSLGFVATTSAGGASAWAGTDWRPLAGKEVWELPDNDTPGRGYSEGVAGTVAALAPPALVKVVVLPGLPDKGDIVDWIKAHGDAADLEAMALELKALADAAEPWRAESPRTGANGKHHGNGNGKHEEQPEQPDDGRPLILVDTAIGRVCDEAAAALARDENLFSRGGGLVQCCRQANGLTLHEVKVPLLRKKMAQTAEFVNRSGHNVFAPLWAAQAIAAAGEWPALRHLTAAVEHPYFNGERVVVEEGYDPTTGILLKPNVTLPDLPTRPTMDDARAACGRLLDLVQDFPFQKDYHRSAWLALVLTLAARHAINGSVPLYLFDASTPGSGKGKLLAVAGLIVHGRKPDMRPATSCDNEFRKALLAVALSGDPLWIQDNVQHVIGGPTLDAAITASIWKDRDLGLTKISAAAIKLVFAATGNNLGVKGDTPRRVVLCRLTPADERPEERRNFHRPDLLADVERERPQLLTDVLTILLAYHQAGRPGMGLPPWGSFEEFSALIRNAIVWIGQPDPYDGREDLRRFTGDGTETLANVLAALHELDPHCRGMTAADILNDLNGLEIKELLVDVAADRKGELTPKSVGNWFKSHKDRIAAGLQLVVRGTVKGGRLAWTALPTNTKDQAEPF